MGIQIPTQRPLECFAHRLSIRESAGYAPVSMNTTTPHISDQGLEDSPPRLSRTFSFYDSLNSSNSEERRTPRSDGRNPSSAYRPLTFQLSPERIDEWDVDPSNPEEEYNEDDPIHLPHLRRSLRIYHPYPTPSPRRRMRASCVVCRTPLLTYEHGEDCLICRGDPDILRCRGYCQNCLRYFTEEILHIRDLPENIPP